MGESGFDLIVGNPPFVRHERIVDPLGIVGPAAYRDCLRRQFEARAVRTGLELPDRRADLCLLFTLTAITLLRPEGVLGFVLPDALFEAGYGRGLARAMASEMRRGVVLSSTSHRSFIDAGVNTCVLVVGPREQSSALRPPAKTFRRVEMLGPLSSASGTRRIAASEARGASSRWQRRPELVALSTIGRLRYAVKTGLNAFFYPRRDVIERFGIESEFLIAALKSPRDVTSIAVEPAQLQHWLFRCSANPGELESRGAGGALAYITWGSGQIQATRFWEDARPWPEAASIRDRANWYSVPVPPAADMILPRFFDRRFFVVQAVGHIVEDQTFYGLILSDDLADMPEVVAGVLNSSPTFLAIECAGRSGLGYGARQYSLGDYADLRVADVRRATVSQRAAIVAAFRPLAHRPILPIEEDMEQLDRRALDAAVGELLGLGESEIDRMRVELVARVARRIGRAREARHRLRGQ